MCNVWWDTYIYKRERTSKASRTDSKQVLELGYAHMARWSCGVATDQWLRQVGDHKTKPHHTQQTLRTEKERESVCQNNLVKSGWICSTCTYKHTWKIPARTVREHAICTLYASRASMFTLPVPFVPFTKKLASGASFSVTVPTIMLITANVPEQKKAQPCRNTCRVQRPRWRFFLFCFV